MIPAVAGPMFDDGYRQRPAGCSGPSFANQLLLALSSADQHRLGETLEPVRLRGGETLLTVGQPASKVIFPETCLVALLATDREGRTIEVGLVGREGCVGWTAVVEGVQEVVSAVVQPGGGTALLCASTSLAGSDQNSPALTRLLQKYFGVVAAQMSGAALAATLASLDARLARWLLMRHDRCRHEVIEVSHQWIADGLGVRRASVTDALHRLEGERLLRCTRGCIRIRDRAGLVRRADGHYGAAEGHYCAAIGPFGR